MQVGFDACGIAAAASIPRDEWDLREWLADGRQADMHYMEEHVDKRYDPTLLFPGAKSVISVLLGYKPSARMQGTHQIAQYAYGEDYHERMKRMLCGMLLTATGRSPMKTTPARTQAISPGTQGTQPTTVFPRTRTNLRNLLTAPTSWSPARSHRTSARPHQRS